MHKEERLEQRAEMGLRVILKVYDARPNMAEAVAMDAFAPGTYNGARSLLGPHPYDDLDAEAAARLIQCLLKRGVICGDAGTLGVAQARLPPRTSRIPDADNGGNGRLSVMLRSELDRAATGRRAKPGLFVHMARNLGFEP